MAKYEIKNGVGIIPEGTTYIESYAFQNCKELKSIVIPKSVTSIGFNSFEGCTGLTGDLVIPDNVTVIGHRAFAGCTGLTSLKVGKNVKNDSNSEKFTGCTHLTNIELNCKGVDYDWGFKGNPSIQSVILGENVGFIGSKTFEGCSGLINVIVQGAATNIDNSAFSETAWFQNHPDGVVYAGKAVYKYKGEMPENTAVVIKEGTIAIVNNAFRNCSGLTSVTIPESVTSIGDSAFYGCTGLTKLDFNCAKIGDWGYKRKTITEIIIGNKVTALPMRPSRVALD